MKYEFLSKEWVGDREVAYILNTETGEVFRTIVKEFQPTAAKATVPKPFPTAGGPVPAPMTFTASSAVDMAPPAEPQDPAGDLETAEQRADRIGRRKVPPAFLGDIRKMHLDPGKTDGNTDVLPTH